MKIIQFRSDQETAFCESCTARVPVIDRQKVTNILGATESEVEQLIEFKKIHLVSAARGCLLVCGNSLTDESVIKRDHEEKGATR